MFQIVVGGMGPDPALVTRGFGGSIANLPSVVTAPDARHVEVVFLVDIITSTGRDPASYSISPFLSIFSVEQITDHMFVLTTSRQVNDQAYVLTTPGIVVA